MALLVVGTLGTYFQKYYYRIISLLNFIYEIFQNLSYFRTEKSFCCKFNFYFQISNDMGELGERYRL